MKNPLRAGVARASFHQQPAPVRFAIADDIDFLVGAHWDAVAAHRGVFLQRDYLAALSSKYRKNIKARVLAPIDAAGLSVGPLTDDAAKTPFVAQ